MTFDRQVVGRVGERHRGMFVAQQHSEGRGIESIGPQDAMATEDPQIPVRIRIGIPPEGLGSRLDQMNTWLDANCGADGWTSTPASTRGVVNDALTICFADAALASACVARWCAMQRVEIVDGVYQVRNDEPTPRIGAALHRTP